LATPPGHSGPPARLAVAASADFPDLRDDWPLLRQALGDLGIEAATRVWTDPAVRWDEFDLVLANGAWDNIHRPDEFLEWVERVAEETVLANSPAVLRWNLDKRYLAALSSAGVATVPTAWLTPGPDHEPDLHELPGLSLPQGDFVVKPTVSGGGFETARYRTVDELRGGGGGGGGGGRGGGGGGGGRGGGGGGGGRGGEARAHVRRLLNAGRTVMIQPYQASVDTQGEAGLIFLGGHYSHAVAKGALLEVDAGPQTHLYQHEQIGPLTPSEVQLEVAHHALTTAERLLGPTTYARVDLVPLDDGTPAVLELELLDPALFFETAPAAVARFAQVLRHLIR
jgi:hypothetical protein